MDAIYPFLLLRNAFRSDAITLSNPFASGQPDISSLGRRVGQFANAPVSVARAAACTKRVLFMILRVYHKHPITPVIKVP